MWVSVAQPFFRACLLFKLDRFPGTRAQAIVSTEPMKMFRLEHETIGACQTNFAGFSKLKTLFQVRVFARASYGCAKS